MICEWAVPNYAWAVQNYAWAMAVKIDLIEDIVWDRMELYDTGLDSCCQQSLVFSDWDFQAYMQKMSMSTCIYL